MWRFFLFAVICGVSAPARASEEAIPSWAFKQWRCANDDGITASFKLAKIAKKMTWSTRLPIGGGSDHGTSTVKTLHRYVFRFETTDVYGAPSGKKSVECLNVKSDDEQSGIFHSFRLCKNGSLVTVHALLNENNEEGDPGGPFVSCLGSDANSSGSREQPKEREKENEGSAQQTINVRTLISAYEDNESRADEKYLGKRYLVKGTVSHVSHEFVRLAEDSVFAAYRESASERALKLHSGQQVLMECEIRGYHIAGLVLSDCEFKK